MVGGGRVCVCGRECYPPPRIPWVRINYHGITARGANEKGSDAKLVFAEFTNVMRQIPDDGFAIAHYMSHEDIIMYTNLDEAGKQEWGRAPTCFVCFVISQIPGSFSRAAIR
jgi:hypothetical protein